MATQPFDMNAMLRAFLGMMQQQQQGQLGQTREALGLNSKLGRYGGRLDPVTGAEPGNPFENGFFKTADQRRAVEASRGPMPGPESLTTNPYFQAMDQPAPAAGAGVLPQTALMSTIMPPATGANSGPAFDMFGRTMAAINQSRQPRRRTYNLFAQ